ncbi:MAG: glycoside hydrolase family 3 C-terminal domain-containing protein [Anaerolineae bacterium]|nr:glycoside hydrolase family 3 C-terminal domain-containing protein [Anaerolineae bacterium]
MAIMSTLSLDGRVNELLGQMSLDEKLAQLGGMWVTEMLDENRIFVMTKAQAALVHGIGHISRISGGALLTAEKGAELANTVQKYLIERTRLGIPAIVHEESCAGFMAPGATTFPQSIGLASTWEPDLANTLAQVIRAQMRAVGAHHTLAPVLDVVRDPRWGRVEETFGEDSYLVSRFGVAYITGVQSDDLRHGIAATGKHFVGYGWPEGGRNWGPVRITERELREVFLMPFCAAIEEAHIASIMNAYHEMDGIPCGSSKELMVDLLRDEMGFDGVVVSDYFTIDALENYHRVAVDAREAARLGLEAGIDIELPKWNYYCDPLRQAVEDGTVDISLVDASVARVLRMKFQLGLFENPYVDESRAVQIFNTPKQRALSLKVAEKSIVLLKNDGLLPLPPNLETIAVIGPSADNIRVLLGDYHYPAHQEGLFYDDTHSDAPNPLQNLGKTDIRDHLPQSVSVLAGIQAMLSPNAQVYYAKGCDITGDDTYGFDKAVAVARQSQVAVVVVGGKSGLTHRSTCGEAVDRADLGLPGVQQQLVEAVYATGTPVVVVLLNGRPYTIPWIADNVPAIVEAWLPAQEGGTAIANVLFGKVNPAGRLPMSFPRSVGQIPVYYNHKPSGCRTHWLGDYADMPVSPLFPFGHGLSYTRFEYSNLRVEPEQVEPTGTVTISIDVENSGEYVGDEVVQLYLSDRIGSVTRPVRELKGFKRLPIQPGERRTLAFHVPASHLGFYDRQMNFVVEPGQVDVMVGSSSADIRASGSFEIVGTVTAVGRVFETQVEVW